MPFRRWRRQRFLAELVREDAEALEDVEDDGIREMGTTTILGMHVDGLVQTTRWWPMLLTAARSAAEAAKPAAEAALAAAEAAGRTIVDDSAAELEELGSEMSK